MVRKGKILMIKFGKFSLFLCAIVFYLVQPTYGKESRFTETRIKNEVSVVDNETGLTWRRPSLHSDRIQDYTEHIEKYKKGWRIPTTEELRSISICGEQRILVRVETGPAYTPLITNQRNDVLFDAYIPQSDSEVVISKRGWIYCVLVKGSLNKNYQGKSKTNCSLTEIGEEIKDLVKITDAAFLYRGLLIPANKVNYSYLTFCPSSARIFVTLTSEFIKNLSVEDLASGYIYLGSDRNRSRNRGVFFYQIKDFYNESKELENLNKFELLNKKEEFITKLVQIHQEYQKEYSKYLSSTFVVRKMKFNPVTLDAYNVESKILTVSPIYGQDYVLPLPLKMAKVIFSDNSKLFAKLFHFVRAKKKPPFGPKKTMLKSSHFLLEPRDDFKGLEHYKVGAKLLIIYSPEGNKLLSVVFEQEESRPGYPRGKISDVHILNHSPEEKDLGYQKISDN